MGWVLRGDCRGWLQKKLKSSADHVAERINAQVDGIMSTSEFRSLDLSEQTQQVSWALAGAIPHSSLHPELSPLLSCCTKVATILQSLRFFLATFIATGIGNFLVIDCRYLFPLGTIFCMCAWHSWLEEEEEMILKPV